MDEVRRKKRSKKGRADKMDRLEGVQCLTGQSVLAGQGWVVEVGGSSGAGMIRAGGGMQKGNNILTHRPTNQEGSMQKHNLGV